MALKREFRLTLDGRKRVSLTKLLPDYEVCSLKAYREGDRIILEPMTELPARDLWLYQHPKIHESLQRGLYDIAAGRIKSLDIDFQSFVEARV